MPPTSSKQTPLPLAPNRASIANEISLLLSRRSALLKTLNPTSTSTSNSTTTTTTTSSKRYAANADAIEQLFSGPRPNQGVGYVPAKSESSASTQDGMLRRKLLGKNAHNQKNGKGGTGMVKGVESESDEDEGRSALGKRKRKRPVREEEDEGEGEGKNAVAAADTDTDVVGRRDAGGGEEGNHDEVDDEGDRILDKGDDAAPMTETATISDNAADEAKRNKKKKKRQREKEKQRQKREQK